MGALERVGLDIGVGGGDGGFEDATFYPGKWRWREADVGSRKSWRSNNNIKYNIKYRPNVNLDNHQQGGDAVGEDVLGSPELAY